MVRTICLVWRRLRRRSLLNAIRYGPPAMLDITRSRTPCSTSATSPFVHPSRLINTQPRSSSTSPAESPAPPHTQNLRLDQPGKSTSCASALSAWSWSDTRIGLAQSNWSPSTLRSALPQPAREVRKLHRHTPLRHRNLAQRTRHTPRHRIINVNIRLKPLTHALHQPITHQIIHPAMPAELARHLTLILPQRRFILLLILIEPRPGVPSGLAVDKNTRWVVAKNSLRTLDQINAIVR